MDYVETLAQLEIRHGKKGQSVFCNELNGIYSWRDYVSSAPTIEDINYVETGNGSQTRWVLGQSNNEAVRITKEFSSGVDGGASVASSFQTLVLNTISNPNSYDWASLSSNQFTLTAGKYIISVSFEMYRTERATGRIRNITDSATALKLASVFGRDLDNVNATPQGKGIVLIAGTKTFELQYYVSKATPTNALGVHTASGENEIFADIFIERMSE